MDVYPSTAGNAGEAGPWYFSSPATGIDVIAVGSVDKYVAEPPSWNLINHRVTSTVTPVQNATVYVNGTEVAPIVSFYFYRISQFLT